MFDLSKIYSCICVYSCVQINEGDVKKIDISVIAHSLRRCAKGRGKIPSCSPQMIRASLDFNEKSSGVSKITFDDPIRHLIKEYLFTCVNVGRGSVPI